MSETPEHLWSENLASVLQDAITRSINTSITWFNHHSVVTSYRSGVDASAFDLVGIDGQFLRALLGKRVRSRTSADLVLPKLLSNCSGLKILVVGGLPENSSNLERFLKSEYSLAVCDVYDGYLGRPTPQQMSGRLYDIAIIGLGAPLQDHYAIELSNIGDAATVITTCGGWLDQVVQDEYYPPWAYRFRVNWLLRLIAEPKRLIRRYTLGGLEALFVRKKICEYLNIKAIDNHEQIAEVGSKKRRTS